MWCLKSFSHWTEGDTQVDCIQTAEVAQYCKSATICNSLHLNKGQTNKNPLRWHANWQTNCLIAVCSVKGASRPWVRGQPKFTSDWSLMARGRFYCAVAVATKLFSSFPTGQNVLFFVHLKCVMRAKWVWGLYVSICFCCGARASPAMNIWAIESPHTMATADAVATETRPHKGSEWWHMVQTCPVGGPPIGSLHWWTKPHVSHLSVPTHFMVK